MILTTQTLQINIYNKNRMKSLSEIIYSPGINFNKLSELELTEMSGITNQIKEKLNLTDCIYSVKDFGFFVESNLFNCVINIEPKQVSFYITKKSPFQKVEVTQDFNNLLMRKLIWLPNVLTLDDYFQQNIVKYLPEKSL